MLIDQEAELDQELDSDHSLDQVLLDSQDEDVDDAAAELD